MSISKTLALDLCARALSDAHEAGERWYSSIWSSLTILRSARQAADQYVEHLPQARQSAGMRAALIEAFIDGATTATLASCTMPLYEALNLKEPNPSQPRVWS